MIRRFLLIELQTCTVVLLFFLIGQKSNRLRLPLHGRIKVPRLGAGCGERVEIGRMLPFGESASFGCEFDGNLARGPCLRLRKHAGTPAAMPGECFRRREHGTRA